MEVGPAAHIVPLTEMRIQPACCGCGATPPAGENDPDSSTLLSMRYGWRVVRQVDTQGGVSVEWRCPSCWNTYKTSRATKTKSTVERDP